MKKISQFIILVCCLLFTCCRWTGDFQKALDFEEQGQYEAAITYLNRVIEKDSMNYMAYVNRGADRSHLGYIHGAIRDYTKAIMVDSTRTVAYMNRAGNLKRLENYEDALNDYNVVLKQLKFDHGNRIVLNGMKPYIITATPETVDEPQYDVFEVSVERGIAYFYLDSLQQAMQNLDFCITNNRYLSDSYYWRGFVYLKLGNNNRACEDLKKSVSLGNEDASVDYKQYCACDSNNVQ